MSITTYSELKTAVANWLHRADLTSYIPDFIAVAETMINDDVTIREMEKRATATADTTTRYLALPTRFRIMRRLQLNTSPISELDYIAHLQMNSVVKSGSGQPIYYSVVGSEIEFDIKPSSAYTVEMSYIEKVQALSDSNTTNSILTNYPSIYLYGSLVAAEPYLANDQRITTWATLYQSAVDAANSSYNSGQHSAGPLTVRAS